MGKLEGNSLNHQKNLPLEICIQILPLDGSNPRKRNKWHLWLVHQYIRACGNRHALGAGPDGTIDGTRPYNCGKISTSGKIISTSGKTNL